MVSTLLALVLQSPAPAGQPVDLAVSVDRVREGLLKPGRFEPPPPEPTGRPLFRSHVEERSPLLGDPWEERSMIPPWIRPSTPPVHFDFLTAVTPEEFRSSTVHPCCDIMPLVSAVNDAVGKRVQAAKQRRAKREVEREMQAAGIRP